MRVLTSYGVPELGWWRDSTDHININQGVRPLLRQVARQSREYDAFIVRGSTGFSTRYAGQLAAAVAARKGLPTLLAECIWETTSRRFQLRRPDVEPGVDRPPPGAGRLATNVISRLDHRNMHYCVLSDEERVPFASRWSVPVDRVYNTGYCATSLCEDYFPEERLEVFAGGNSLRDYRSLISAAGNVTAAVRIATTLVPARSDKNLNIGWLSTDDYEARSRSAAVIVVPLADGLERSAGQQTYLNAMLAGKPVVVTDVLGVREHVKDGKTGIIVPPNDPDALTAALDHLLSSRKLREELGDAARADVLENYTRDLYFKRLLDAAAGIAKR